MNFRKFQLNQNTIGFNVSTGISNTVELCAKCKKNNGEELCAKCQKALSAEKRIDMSIPIIRRIKTFLTEEGNIKKRVMIDLDGTIHKYSQGWKDGSIYDDAFDGAKESIENLRDKGYQIVIHTARLYNDPSEKDGGYKTKDEVAEWLDKNDIYYDDITHEKMPAEFYIDDKAIQIKNGNWDEVMKQVEKIESANEDVTKKIDRLLIKEMVVVGGSYINGTTVNVIGSGQTRAVGGYDQYINILQQKEPDNKNAVKFNKLLGAFVPSSWQTGIVDPEEDKGDLE
jgi:hypothetical protein